MEQEFTVELVYTDRSRNDDGSYVEYRTRVTVLATNHEEALMVATQMALGIRADLNPLPLSANVIL